LIKCINFLVILLLLQASSERSYLLLILLQKNVIAEENRCHQEFTQLRRYLLAIDFYITFNLSLVFANAEMMFTKRSAFTIKII
jgi:hypothetical protein